MIIFIEGLYLVLYRYLLQDYSEQDGDPL